MTTKEDKKFYLETGYVLIRPKGKHHFIIEASALPEDAEPVIRAETGYTGEFNWTYSKGYGTYTLETII